MLSMGPEVHLGFVMPKITYLLAAGNMRHLIVEACMARNLLDTSAYFWPGYINGRVKQTPHGMSSQVPSWPSFMNGAPLTPVMVNALVSTPASRYCLHLTSRLLSNISNYNFVVRV